MIERHIMARKLFNIGLQFFADQTAAGEKVQEVAAPETDIDTDTDVDSTDIDTDEDIDDEGDDDYGEPDTDDITEPAPEPKQNPKGSVQSPEQNAAFRNMRLKIEAEARTKAQAEAARAVDQAIAGMGLCDPYNNNKPITTKAEYDAYKARHETEVIGKELGKVGISREAMDALINAHPAIKQAQEASKAYQDAQRSAQEQSAKVRLDEQIKEISSFDSSVQSADDLFKLPEYPQIREYVRKGLSITEAYKLTNMDKLTEKKTAAAAQTAINKVASKEHLTPSAARGQGDIPVPKKVLKQYMDIAGMTEKEARAHYQKFMKGK